MKKLNYLLATMLALILSTGLAKANVGDVITSLDQLSNSKCYTIKAPRGALVMNTSGTAACSSHTGNGGTVYTSASTTAEDGQWAILTLNGNSYYLYNVGARKFLNADNTITPAQKSTLTLKDLTSPNGNYKFKITSGSNTLNNNNQGGFALDGWSTEDNGNKLVITEAGDFDPSIFDTQITYTYNYLFNGEVVYTESRTSFRGEEYSAIKPQNRVPGHVSYSGGPTGTVQSTDQNKTYDIVCTLDKAKMPFKYSSSFEDAKWYQIKIERTPAKYAKFDGTNISNSTTAPTETTAEDRFAFVGNPFGFKIYNQAAGADKAFGPEASAANATLTASDATNGATFVFEISSENNLNRIFRNVDNEVAYLNDINSKLGYWYSTNNRHDAGSNFTFIEYIDPTKAIDITYNYQNNGTTLYSETFSTNVGDEMPAPKTVPHGVTVETPTGTVQKGVTSYDIPVTWTQESTGIKFFDSVDEVDTWYAWSKRNAWYAVKTAYVYHIEDAEGYTFADNVEISNDSYLWAAIGNPYSFKIANKAKGAGYFLSNPNTTINDSDQPTMKQGEGQSYFLFDCAGSQWGDYCFQVLGTSTPTALNGNGTLNYWVNNSTLGDPGSQMRWVEPDLTATALDQLIQGQAYTITSAGGRGSFIYTDNGLNSTYQTGIAANASDKNQQFMFVKYNENYYLYSVGAKAFINITGKNETNNRAVAVEGRPANTTLEFLASTYSDKASFPVVLQIDGHHVGISNGYTPAVITHYNSLADQGNALCIKAVWGATYDTAEILELFTPNWTSLESAIAKAQSVTIGTGYGEFTQPEGYADALASAIEMNTNRTATADEVDDAIAAIAISKLTLNIPANGALIRIKDNDGNYMTCNNNSSNSDRIEFSATKDDASIFCYTGSALVAYKTGLYAANTTGTRAFPTNATSVIEESDATLYKILQSGLTLGKYAISFGSSTRFMYTNANAGTFNSAALINNVGYEFTIEAVESVPVTISSAKMATLYSPQALEIPAGVTAYTGAYDNATNTIKLTALEGTIPANTGVILEGEANTTYDFNIATSGEGTSCFGGTLPAISTTTGAYTLQVVDGQLGFYRYTGESLAGFKAFFTNSTGAKGFSLVKDNDLTGINGVTNTTTDGVYYDLMGNVVKNPLKNHIYILNGTKVLK